MPGSKGCWEIFLFKTKILKIIKIFIPNHDSKMVTADMLGLAISSLCGVVGAWDFLLSLSAARVERRKDMVQRVEGQQKNRGARYGGFAKCAV